MPTFPVEGKPLVNELECFFAPTNLVEETKKAKRMASSKKARKHRTAIKKIDDRRSLTDRSRRG